MKNTTKKILSMVLAMIMLLSVVPVAYAERITYSPEIEQYLYYAYKLLSYFNSVYTDGYRPRFLNEEDRNRLDSLGIDWPVARKSELHSSNFINNIDEIIEMYKSAVEEIELKIESGEVKVYADTSELWKYVMQFEMYHGVEDNDELLNLCKNNKYEKMRSEFEAAYEICIDDYVSVQGPMRNFTQAEFDALMAKIRPYLDLCLNCLDGNHPYGEYISDKNATCTEYGTKTATCEFCGATDTVTDKASGLASHNGKAILVTEATCTTDGYTTYNCECGYVYDGDYKPATGHSYIDGKCTVCDSEYANCSCNCHKSGFMGFIWKIINFFNKIFGSNKTCACGAEHY